MKTIRFIFLSLISFIAFTFYVSAECTNEEILKFREDAKSIKTNYNVEQRKSNEYDPETGDYIEKDFFVLKFVNVPNNFYIKLTDDYDNSNKVLTNISNNTLSADFMVQDDGAHNIHYEIYTNNTTSCPNELLTDNYILLPQHNRYSQMDICVDSEIPECQEYVKSEVTYDKFIKETRKEADKKVEEEKRKQKEKEKKDKNINTKYIIIGGAAIVVIGIISVVVIRRVHERKVRGF